MVCPPSIGADGVAGAGNSWSYTTKSGENVRRSEGLAVASLEMYLDGLFSDDPQSPYQVTGKLAFSRHWRQLIHSGWSSRLDIGEIINCVPGIPRKSNVGVGRSMWTLIPPSRCFRS
jgi:hypothetical protein